uniref:EGF-like domain-containing protein n=1 Tax=Parascaris equorum TaxID=6256 RepID=A0A914RSV0_PAREQ
MAHVKTGYRWIESNVFPRTVESLKNRPACKVVDPCAEGDLCPSPLKCISSDPGLYECVCKDGYEKIPSNQGTCIDIDECNLETNAAPCPMNSHCENLKGSYKCECNTGFTPQIGSSLIDPECVDINECSAGIDNCAMKNATCTNTIGSFECVCAEGFQHNAPDYETCQDVDECLDGTAECDEHAICKNTMGSYECDCKEGFFGDGALCMAQLRVNRIMSKVEGHEPIADIDECKNIPSPCPPTSVDLCVNTQGGFKCTCRTGFKKPRNCHGNKAAKCSNTRGGYKCVCAPGYDGDPYVDGCKGMETVSSNITT